jgi:hypothetical protein
MTTIQEQTMPHIKLALIFVFAAVGTANAQSLITCEPMRKSYSEPIWPEPYISKAGDLCFNVKGWPEYSGNNCAANDRSAYWKGGILLVIEGKSKGRDLLDFRVVNPKVTDNHIEYKIEWKRDGDWQTMQNISINRFTGTAVRYFNAEHGGESYKCHGKSRKF